MTLKNLFAPETKGMDFGQAGTIALRDHPCVKAHCQFGEWENGICKNANHAICHRKLTPQ